jgi:hypothetical protein
MLHVMFRFLLFLLHCISSIGVPHLS